MTRYAYPWPTQHLGTIPDAYGQVGTPHGSHLALVRADARHGAQVRTRPALAGVHTLYSLYIASTCTKHRYERLAEALQLYSALQRSTSLQLYILYSIHPSTAPL